MPLFNFYGYMIIACSPLGPFVPAPPEVAMRMFREQGGPSPFEGGRNERTGPQISGSAPIIALPPSFHQDPRRLRRSVVFLFLLLSTKTFVENAENIKHLCLT